MMRWIADQFDAFRMDVWPTVRWVAYAYLAVMVLFLVASPDVRWNLAANAHRLSCHFDHLAGSPSEGWRGVDCEAWFYRR
jgi:hypothetical protein